MDESTLQALRLAPQEKNQRVLAKKLGFSLGKTNYILKGLVEKGYIKVERFMASDQKAVYRYVLTPKGIRHRISLTEAFIKRKKIEYEELEKDLKKLKNNYQSNQ